MSVSSKKILAVLGPTGSGKSRFAIEVAKKVCGEIISCDSMAVYKGVDIATDKIPFTEREEIPHHLYDVAEAGTFFSAGLFRKMALEEIENILERKKIPIIVGGTGLYARALLSGMAEAPSRDDKLREKLKSIADKKGTPHLHAILQKLDKERALSITINDKVRIIRAIELRILTGRKFSEIASLNKYLPEDYQVKKICLYYPREILYKRIENRVDQMVQRGLFEEVKALYDSKKLSGPLSKAIGIKEIIPCLEGNKKFEDAVAEIKQHTRNLAKRQLTWFKKEIELKWIVMDDEDERARILDEIERWSRGESYEW